MTSTSYKPISMMKKELRRIVRDIDEKLYNELKGPLDLPWQAYEEFDTAELYFIEQLMNNELRPWAIAECLRNLGHSFIADNLEMFASTFDFSTKAMNDMDSMDRMEIEVKMQNLKEYTMATSKRDIREMKMVLRKIARKINTKLYSKLTVAMKIPVEVYQELETAKLYFIDELIKGTLQPWHTANCLRMLGYDVIACDFELFANIYNFPKDEPKRTELSSYPEISVMQLIKKLKEELTNVELLSMRNSGSKTFESIFNDFLILDKLTPSLEILKNKLQGEDREDLASLVVIHAQTISSLSPVRFSRLVSLCLDTLDVDIVGLMANLRASLAKQYSSYHLLSEQGKEFSLSEDFTPLTFIEEVDKRTLPLTEGSDAELQMLLKHGSKRKETERKYINAHTEIYSESMDRNLICLIGHPGSGKTFYCKKLIHEFFMRKNECYRFVFFIACCNSKWHALEEKCIDNPGEISAMMKLFLQIVIPYFQHSEELTRIVQKTDGNGMLLVIDSFDEFPQRFNFSGTLLYRILKRQVLSECTILITSRPGAWNQLLRGYGSELSFDHSWQLLGFSPDQRDQFIKTILTPEKAISCQKFLETKPELNILSLIPVNISLIVSLIDSTTSLSHINTLTDMYTSLVVYTLYKELRCIDTSAPGIASLQEMPADMLLVFNKLAELSYTALLSKKITFSITEFMELSDKYTKGLGLFHIIRVETRQKTTIDYLSCPHLTLQEFLSAWYLAQKSTTEIASIVQKTFSDDTWPAMKMCIRFLCGLLTQGHNTILSIITDNLHSTSAPLLNCKYSLFETGFNEYSTLHYSNTDNHLSILPYVLETNQPSSITSYYKLLCPANTTIPHFHLRDSITSVDSYSLTQLFSLLPPNSAISVLTLDITLLNSIQLDMLASSINNSSIDTLLVKFSSITDTTLEEYYKEQLSIYKEDIKYKLQQKQLHINTDNMSALLEELNSTTTDITNIYALQYVLSTLKLPISNFTLHADITIYQKLFSFIRNISNDSCFHTPNQKCYQFEGVSFMDDIIINSLIDSISTHATFVMLTKCYFTTPFITTLATSLQKLEYLYIDDETLKSLRPLFNQQTINALTFQMLKERNMKGLYLRYVTLQDDSILYGYLHSQSSLQEIYLSETTDSTPATLHAILHLSSLQYLYIYADDRAFIKQHAETEESISALFTTLHNNRHTLSYANFSLYRYFLTARYADIMLTLSLCSNLQCIDFSTCSLTPLHMQAIATCINQLPALLYINLGYNRDITDEGIIKLTNALDTHNTVVYIDLYKCSISSAPVIISFINKFPSLQKIGLSGNKFNHTSKQEVRTFTKQRKIYLGMTN